MMHQAENLKSAQQSQNTTIMHWVKKRVLWEGGREHSIIWVLGTYRPNGCTFCYFGINMGIISCDFSIKVRSQIFKNGLNVGFCIHFQGFGVLLYIHFQNFGINMNMNLQEFGINMGVNVGSWATCPYQKMGEEPPSACLLFLTYQPWWHIEKVYFLRQNVFAPLMVEYVLNRPNSKIIL